jgi:hypothetical protein
MDTDLQSEVTALRARMDALESRSGLMSTSWWKRAFTVLVYGAAMGAIVWLGLYLLGVVLAVLLVQ